VGECVIARFTFPSAEDKTMASVIRRYDRRPIPEKGEIITRRGEKMVRFKDRWGRTQVHALSDDASCLLVERRRWYVVYQDANNRRQFVKAYVDREASEQLGRDLERQAAREKAGLATADRTKTHAPITEALDFYLEDLERRGTSAFYRYNMGNTMRQIMRGCGWTTMPTIRADKLTSWLAAAKKEGKAARTLNFYLDTARKFVSWCVDKHYLGENPLLSIRKAEEKGAKTRIRRALSAEQLALLLEVSRSRRLCYLMAMLTGLRRGEMKKLLWTELFLDDPRPYVWPRAHHTKAKRDDIIPLPPELVEVLRAARPANVGPDTRVFPTVPCMETFKKDLSRAGIAFLDERGRRVDFHALRTSYNMLLAKQNVPIRTAKELMRHSDIRLTAQVYNDPAIYDLSAAVNSLPRIGKNPEEESKSRTG
jgi:integrase